MVVLVNGAFEVGKTSVVRVEGFKDLASWQRLTVPGANCCGSLVRSVIHPMAFANPDHLREIRSGLAKSGKPVLHFCLVATVVGMPRGY